MTTFFTCLFVLYAVFGVAAVLDLLRLWPPSPRYRWRRQR